MSFTGTLALNTFAALIAWLLSKTLALIATLATGSASAEIEKSWMSTRNSRSAIMPSIGLVALRSPAFSKLLISVAWTSTGRLSAQRTVSKSGLVSPPLVTRILWVSKTTSAVGSAIASVESGIGLIGGNVLGTVRTKLPGGASF